MSESEWKMLILKYEINEYELSWRNLWNFFKQLTGWWEITYPLILAPQSYTVSLWVKGENCELISDISIKQDYVKNCQG